jgi:hypothetical protein
MAALHIGKPGYSVGGVDRLVKAMRAVTPQLPEALMPERGLLVAVLMMNGLAEHSRMLETKAKREAPELTRRFIANLEDCVVAVLAAPVSEETAALL